MNSKCPICHSSEGVNLLLTERLLGTREKFKYRKCLGCELVYLDQEILDFSKYYPNEYHNDDSKIKLSFLKKFASHKLIQYNILRESFIGKMVGMIFESINGYRPEPNVHWIGDAINIIKNKDKNTNPLDLNIVDIGCGGGILLSHLEGVGFKKLSGIEPFTEPQKKYIKKMNIVDFLDQDGEHGKYDIVILSHVLEHLDDHKNIIFKLKKLLTKNGILLIAMPFIGKSFEKYGINLMSLDAPRHLIIHSLKSFRWLVGECGLDIESEFYEQSYWELAASEMYCWDIGFFEGRKYGLLEVNKKANVAMAKAMNKLGGGGSSVTFYLSARN